MSLTEDLARLKELDPATYRTYIDGAAIHGVLLAEKGGDPLQMAWLQWCLQEAIAANGWILVNRLNVPVGHKNRAFIFMSEDEYNKGDREDLDATYAYGESDIPAASLLAAYIAALEAQG